METKDFGEQLNRLSALDDPVRRKLYLYVVGRAEDVSRDEAAQKTGVSRALAAFHLDKLEKAGLLVSSFRRLSGRGGPGAGRPSKLYRRAAAQLEVSLPPRRYELAAHVFAEALAESERAPNALTNAARSWGAKLAKEPGLRSPRGLPLTRAMRALEVCGFEPRRHESGEVVLGNCPFDTLRADSRELVCGMNLALIEGLIDGLGLEGVRARLAPRPGMCCVALRGSAS